MASLQNHHVDFHTWSYQHGKMSIVSGGGHQKLGKKTSNHISQWRQTSTWKQSLLSFFPSWRAFSLTTYLSMTSVCHPQGKATFVVLRPPPLHPRVCVCVGGGYSQVKKQHSKSVSVNVIMALHKIHGCHFCYLCSHPAVPALRSITLLRRMCNNHRYNTVSFIFHWQVQQYPQRAAD